MPGTIVFDIGPDGVVRFIASDEAADIAGGLGRRTVRRASHVEFDNEAQGWVADMSPLGVDVRLGPYVTRAEALKKESDWLLEQLPGMNYGDGPARHEAGD
jgi:hypothetical protein